MCVIRQNTKIDNGVLFEIFLKTRTICSILGNFKNFRYRIDIKGVLCHIDKAFNKTESIKR